MPPGENTPLACYDATGAKVVKSVKDSAFGLLGTAVIVTPIWGPDGVSPGNNGRDDSSRRGRLHLPTLVPLLPLPPINVTAESTLVVNN